MKQRLFNEGKACDAIIQYLEAREGDCRQNFERPELEKHHVPGNKHVELTFKLSNKLYALEHTGIEPFPNQIESEKHSDDLFLPVVQQVIGKLPKTEYFKLCVPAKPLKLKRDKIRAIQESLVKWIVEVAPALPVDGHCIATDEEKRSIPDAPFEVKLYRYSISPFNSDKFGGSLKICYAVNASVIEAEREARIRTACGTKCNKLSQWKQSDNANTILVLEENDLALTNHELVAKAFIKAEKQFTIKPDEVYLVSTVINSKWWITVLRKDCRYYQDIDEGRSWEVDPSTLVDICK